jgi:uncharacterized membrane protein YeaQ/YmgE (transglycosylase-associated protein family)
MAEPLSHSAIIGLTAYTTGQTLALHAQQNVPEASFLLFGASPEAFILGLIGAFAVCAWQDDFDNPRKTYAGIFLAMLLAGVGSPAAATVVTNHVGYIKESQLLYILPLLIGVLVPVVGPSIFRWLKHQWSPKK